MSILFFELNLEQVSSAYESVACVCCLSLLEPWETHVQAVAGANICCSHNKLPDDDDDRSPCCTITLDGSMCAQTQGSFARSMIVV